MSGLLLLLQRVEVEHGLAASLKGESCQGVLRNLAWSEIIS